MGMTQRYEPERSHQFFEDSLSSSLSFCSYANSFLKNNEYFSPYTQGFTGIGVFFQPQLRYQLDAKTKIHIGYHFLKYSGLNSVSESIPLFRLEHQFSSFFTLVMGQLYSGLHHDLEEPHYRIDRDYQNNVEYGIQLFLDKEWIHVDSWLHWAQFIQRNDPFPESIYAGQNYDIRLFENEVFGLYANAELLISHQGGQIDVPSDIDRTLLNTMIGVAPQWKLAPHKSITLQAQYYISKVNKQVADVTSEFYYPYESGSGLLLRGRLELHDISASLSYWTSQEYISSIGESLYESISDFDRSIRQPSRKMVVGRINYDRPISDYLDIELQSNAYFDLDDSHLDYSYQLTLRLDFSVILH